MATNSTPGIEEIKTRAPVVSLLLAYVATVPILAGPALSLTLSPGASDTITWITIIWSSAILCFLAGVRRGLSFRQPDGPALAQLAGMFWLFVLRVSALLSPWRVWRSLCS